MKINLTDITDIKCISQEFYYYGNVQEYQFSCLIKGNPSVLKIEKTNHDNDEYGFNIHVMKDNKIDKEKDLWQSMSISDLYKLESLLSMEAYYYPFQKDLEEADSEETLRDVWYSFAEDESFPRALVARFKEDYTKREKELGIEEER